MTGTSTQGIQTVLHPVSDLAKAKAVYTALLGVPPQTDEPYYVGYEGPVSTSGWCPTVDRRASPRRWPTGMCRTSRPAGQVIAAGAAVKEPARDVGGGRLVATVTDPDGNVLGLIQDRSAPTPLSRLTRHWLR